MDIDMLYVFFNESGLIKLLYYPNRKNLEKLDFWTLECLWSHTAIHDGMESISFDDAGRWGLAASASALVVQAV